MKWLFLLVSFSLFCKGPIFIHEKELLAATEAIKEGGNVLLYHWHLGTGNVETARIQTLDKIKEHLKKLVPEIGFWGEDEELVWLIEPLDGNEAFQKVTQDFGIQIALMEKKIPIASLGFYPVKKILYIAEAECGAYKQYKSRGLQKIEVADLKKGVLPITSHKSESINSFFQFLSSSKKKSLKSEVKLCPSIGLCSSYVADGKKTIYMTEEKLSLATLASNYVIVQEAGGFIADLKGNALQFDVNSNFNFGLICSAYKDLFDKSILK